MADITVPATEQVAKPAHPQDPKPLVIIPHHRAYLCYDAAFEISLLTGVIGRELEHDPGSAEFEVLMKILLKRMRDLACVVVSVHGSDDLRKTAEMYELVNNERAPDPVIAESKAFEEQAA